MRVVMLGFLVTFLLVFGFALLLLWKEWNIYLHLYEKKLLVELRCFGIRRKLVFRDFSKKPKKEVAEAKESKGNSGKRGLSERWEKEKKRVYDPEKGGYQRDGIREAYREYRMIIGELFGDMRYRIKIPYLWVRLDFGTGDPAKTGMIYGSVWNLVGAFYPIFRRYFDMSYPTLEITPDFYEKRFDLEWKSIIKVRPAHIINAVFKQVWRQVLTYCSNYFNKGSVKYHGKQTSN